MRTRRTVTWVLLMSRGELADLVAQAIFHSFLAALVVEALLRLWRVSWPPSRVTFRLLPLLLPLVTLPFFFTLAPERTSVEFRETWAVFAGRRWADVRVLGVGLYGVWIAVLAGTGVLLFLRDVVPLAREALGPRPPAPMAAAPAPREVTTVVEELAALAGVRPPPALLVERAAPLIMCAGARRPRLIVSRTALEALDAEELRSALAHEIAHIARRDPVASWLLMVGRAVMFFNPVFQVTARLASRETEWRADSDAVALTGERLALASSILKLYRASPPVLPGVARMASLDGPLARASSAAIIARCRRLIDGDWRPLAFSRVRIALTALYISALLFFVV